MKRSWWILILILLPATGSGTTMIELSVDDLAQQADLIFMGRCTGRSVHFNRDETLIYSDYTFKVEKVIKGKNVSEAVLRQVGGEIGEIGLRMLGTARFLPLEDVLVFAGPGKRGPGELTEVRRLVGLSQGKFRIITDEKTGERYAVRDITELLLVRNGGKKDKALIQTPIRLEDFIRQIEAGILKGAK
jgi:hypothetical protein